MTVATVMDVIARLLGCQSRSEFPNQNVQIFGYVFHDRNGPNHDQTLKTQWFLLNEICMVILWQDYYGKGNLRKSYAYSYTVKKDYSYLCMGMTSNWLEKQNINPMWHPLAGLLWERQFEEVLLGFGREEVPNYERLFVHRTKARVAWKVVLYFSNLESICSHALILLSPTRWFVMTVLAYKHQATAFCSTTAL